MGKTVEKPQTTAGISDQDLVELAGKHAYANVEKNDRIMVNGTISVSYTHLTLPTMAVV